MQELLTSFQDFLGRNGISQAGISAVVQSLESQIGASSKSTVDIAEFLSAWKCGAGIHAELGLTPHQRNLTTQISRILSAGPMQKQTSASSTTRPRRLSCYGVASSGKLMDFFMSADAAGDGYLSLDEADVAMRKLIRESTWASILDTEENHTEIRILLKAADVTGRGSLNYLEFIRIFDLQDAKCLTSQNVLDTLCLQVWLHRNALSFLYRHIGNNRSITKEQVAWSLRALNQVVDGHLDEEHIDSLVGAVSFVDGSIPAEKFLRSFDIHDSHRSSTEAGTEMTARRASKSKNA